ncbi:MAG: 2,3-bisphosphoglycerate-independent phosphoglycerate mutase [Turicibacter sp.]|nr:2,3-bisphosphoglycerate-independent phosphoglycerate mutase [Turicibacter sp.]
MPKKTTVLLILDGFGLSEEAEGNAIAMAKTPNLDKYVQGCFGDDPFCQKGSASGMDVGLPDGQMGNSEVGHTNIGAGRIVYQELTRITKSIRDGDFYQNPAFMQAVENCKKNDSALHLYGLISNGGVHSHNTHLYALLELARRQGLRKVFVHAFLDGRDTPPTSGKGFLLDLEERMMEFGVGKVATIAGRYYAMDRDTQWDRVEKAYKAMTAGEGKTAVSVLACMEASYAEGVNDEFVVPTIVEKEGIIQNNDSIIFFNFRPDRAREITMAFCADKFDFFPRKNLSLTYVCMTDYDPTIGNKLVAYEGQSLSNTMGEYLSSKGLTQLRLAETTKYAHVTYFFNGGVEEPYKDEDRKLVPTPEVATFDLKPEMSAREVATAAEAAIGNYDVIIMNFANPDMVGHTGIIPATIKAVETVDECVGRVIAAVKAVDGQIFMCADHGNADKMIDTTGEPFTAHTTNPVPFVLINTAADIKGLQEGGKLCDISPTLLDLLGLPQPPEMTGKSLLKR